ncbi:hypothetical protein MWQ88_001819 [Staphylococcus pseudintermedius]|uniref:Uncharacterized protein n=1 Tax=Staphylococcus phage SpT152 TaxID=1913446 RepID=A0A1J0MFF6_9CAUD|nr:hypothetical protein [Staphylococcus pseudintermedius]YP_010081936.1 hypothetical protein KMD13_gp37 [Staphylococcus phage SpT152]APD19852.1 hypothetical protein SpT152_037 [Staphylococcus phage SpT152]EGQ0298356.1 hypothetical protein [Staphylococcus pseudintermedius]EGQ1585711.1 hypothetical protein [Staphylococcus pseudintermedius]EGQ2787667.1 hypothetical protein [Staphylococcus pseudintermedius]EGQ2894353.1 hypothetical protein [Staphylococcus pseudintermedius]
MKTLKLSLKVGAIRVAIYAFRQLYLANVTLKAQHDTVPKQERALIDAARAIGLSEIDIGRLLVKINQIMEDSNNE